MKELYFIALLMACGLAIWRWQWGFFAVIVIGLIQDPLRKLIPGSTGLYAMSIVPVWILALAGGLFSGQLRPGVFLGTFPRLGRWLAIFAGYLVIPAAISATYAPGTWQITLLGLMIYSMAIFTLFAGSCWSRSELVRTRFFAFYAMTAGVALVGGPLEYFLGSDANPALGSAALGTTWVTHRTGEAVYMLTGFFRGPDIMGWHASMVFMVAVVMAIRSDGIRRYLWIALAIWAIPSIWICGRRKIISMLPIFAGYFIFLFSIFKNIRRIFASIGLIIMIGVFSGHVILSYMWQTEVYDFYMTTFSEAGDQFKRHGFDSVLGTIEQAGFWGYGLGMGQQGTHHIKTEKPRLWQESGPTKIIVELGVPGAIIFVMIMVLIFITAHAVLKARARAPDFMLSAGIVSILVANLVAALISAQIYTDPFIAFMLATLTGLLFSSIRFADRSGHS